MAIQKELRRYSSQKSIRGLSHSSTSRPFSTRSKIKLTGARENRVTHRRSQDGTEERVIANAKFIQELLRKYCQSDGGSVTVYR